MSSAALSNLFDDAIAAFIKTLPQSEIAEFKGTTIIDVYEEMDRIQRLQEDKCLLRYVKRVKPFVEGISRYASIIEVLISSKPDLLALIWVRQMTLDTRRY
jgi:hypothetical protein